MARIGAPSQRSAIISDAPITAVKPIDHPELKIGDGTVFSPNQRRDRHGEPGEANPVRDAVRRERRDDLTGWRYERTT